MQILIYMCTNIKKAVIKNCQILFFSLKCIVKTWVSAWIQGSKYVADICTILFTIYYTTSHITCANTLLHVYMYEESCDKKNCHNFFFIEVYIKDMGTRIRQKVANMLLTFVLFCLPPIRQPHRQHMQILNYMWTNIKRAVIKKYRNWHL